MKQVFRELAIINAKLDNQGDMLDVLVRAGNRPRPDVNPSGNEFERPQSTDEDLLKLDESVTIDTEKKMRLVSDCAMQFHFWKL